MREVHGVLDGFDICRDRSRRGNCFYVDDGSSCGIVYFPTVETLRKVSAMQGTIPNGRLAGKCGRCQLFRGTGQTQACQAWIDKLNKEVKEMRTYINVRKENSLFSSKSYVAKVVNFEGDAVQRKYLPLYRGFYNCKPADPESLCAILIDPTVIEAGDYLAVRLVWGKAAKPGFVDKEGHPAKIKETYYRVETQPSQNTGSLMDCLNKITYAELKAAFDHTACAE